MKILLAAINAKYIHSNLAVYSLKAYAQRTLAEDDRYHGSDGELERDAEPAGQIQMTRDMQIELAEFTINQPKDGILMDIYRRRPDVLCFSCYIWNMEYVEAILREYGKLSPKVPIWLGGPEVSYDAGEVLERLPQVKGVMKGEGEETFAELCKAYCNAGFSGDLEDLEDKTGNAREKYGSKREIDAILWNMDGITFREESCGQIIDRPWRKVMDLSRVPFIYSQRKPQQTPGQSDKAADSRNARLQIQDFEHKILYYESSRGCPFSCSYCLSSIDKKLRFRDLELVKRELQFLIDQEVPQVKFVDRTFNCKHDHAMAIWQYILDHDQGKTNFHFEIAADLLNEEELQLLEQMRPGLVQLEIGVQSTNPDAIREIRRTMDFGKVKENVNRIHRNGNIHQHLDLIAGLPYEDISSFARSFDDVYALKPEQLQLGFLKVLKGSYMEAERERYGLVCQSRPPYEVLYTKWLSYDDVMRLKGIEEMLEVYYNSRQFTNTINALEAEYDSAFAMYDELWKFYMERGYGSIQQKRSARYDILLEYIKGTHPAMQEYYRELLVYDYYLRENAKTRPEFAGEYQITKEQLRGFYEWETQEHQYLPAYVGYDPQQLRRMTHLEYFPKMGKYVLFDYRERSPLNQEARTDDIPELSVAKTM